MRASMRDSRDLQAVVEHEHFDCIQPLKQPTKYLTWCGKGCMSHLQKTTTKY